MKVPEEVAVERNYPPALLRSWASQSVGFPTETQGAKAICLSSSLAIIAPHFCTILSAVFQPARAASDCLMHNLEDINDATKGFAIGAVSGL